MTRADFLWISAAGVAGAARAATSSDDQKRAEELLARMTLDEKIGQMSQSTSMRTPLSDVLKNEIRQGRWGSFLNAGGPAERDEAQRIATTETRLKIPLLFGRDVIHGYRTIFPIPLGQSASWNPDLVQKAARIAAEEASVEGIHWAFAPMLDITRDPRWGRVAEGFGEDPFLASEMGVATVRGLQGEALDSPESVAACAKHFVGYGAAEGGKEYNSTWIPETVLREIYLPPFHAVCDAGVATVMTGFNAINGVPATGNLLTLRRILRGEWKFAGPVVSDYTAVPEMVDHGFAADAADAARKAIKAGIDMEMVSTTYFDYAKGLLQSGNIRMVEIDEAVRRLLRLKFDLGLFGKRRPAPRAAKISADSLETARQLAMESAVLLKNERDTLPLSRTIRKVAILGPLADAALDQMGTWVMDGRSEEVQTPLAALQNSLGLARVSYASALANSRDNSHAGFPAAISAAKDADAIVLFLGEEQILSGEAHSRAFLGLPGAQEALIAEVAALKKPTIAVILAGLPLAIGAVTKSADALLYAWHPGTMGGPAIASLLFGESAPSGRLTMTMPRAVGQVPIYYAHLNTGRPPTPDQLGIPSGDPVNPTGYTSKYIDVDFTPEYPFGFGLTYTRFEYRNLRFSSPTLRAGGTITVSAEIVNRGPREGTEVVQFYVRQLVASVARPVRQLKGYRRVHLMPGESSHVEFPLTARDLAFYTTDNKLVNQPSKVRCWIAPNALHGLEGEFALE